MLVIPIDDDRIKSLGARYESYDLEVLATITRAQRACKAEGTVEPLLRLLPGLTGFPAPTQQERVRVRALLDRLIELKAPAVMLHRYRCALEPIAALDALLRMEDPPLYLATSLALRDRLDVPRESLAALEWLLVPELRGCPAFWEDAPAEAPAFTPAAWPGFCALHGSSSFTIDGVEVLPKGPYGNAHPWRFHAPDGLPAVLAELARAASVAQQDLTTAWAETAFRIAPFSVRLNMSSDGERAAYLDELRARAPELRARALRRALTLAQRLGRYFRRAQRRGWGVFVDDELDP
ncbi:MAG: hypothetical protein JNK56_19795 [Myxococcales bacterium]|nr:hypothetical protein [Myxococcales bacterium]